jgi:exoribonuclease R
MYKLIIEDRNYTNVSVVDAYTLKPRCLPKQLNPIANKLFNHDIFDVVDYPLVVYSPVRIMKGIPGILVLQNNKTFGKHKDKFLYKCIPDDRRLPTFIVPYALKLGFSKNIDNKYIVFRYNNWNGKHPQGTVISVLGDVDILANYYEYQLYCKNLNISMQEFIRATSNAMKRQNDQFYITGIMEKYKNIENRLYEEIISIDPPNSQDFDDAFSITMGDEPKTYKISIYISNVA